MGRGNERWNRSQGMGEERLLSLYLLVCGLEHVEERGQHHGVALHSTGGGGVREVTAIGCAQTEAAGGEEEGEAGVVLLGAGEEVEEDLLAVVLHLDEGLERGGAAGHEVVDGEERLPLHVELNKRGQSMRKLLESVPSPSRPSGVSDVEVVRRCYMNLAAPVRSGSRR